LRRDTSTAGSPAPTGAGKAAKQLGNLPAHAEAPISPSSTALPSTKATGLKSCLSSRKVRPPPASARRSVVFGSPNVAEFTRGAPTNAMTPLDKAYAKSLFSMVGSVAHAQAEE
jgi:hypothetical protein